MIDANHNNILSEDAHALNIHQLLDKAMIDAIDILHDLEDDQAVNLHEVLDEIELFIPSAIDMLNGPKDDNGA